MDIRIRYLTTRHALNGKTRYYWQPSPELVKAGWKIMRLAEHAAGTDAEMRAAAIAEAQRYNEDLDRWYGGLRDKPQSAKDGSLEWLIGDYKKSWRFTEKKQKTRDSYEYAFRYLIRTMGDFPYAAVTKPMVQKIYSSMKGVTPAKASAIIRVLRIVLEHGVREGKISTNAASKPGMSTYTEKGQLWSPAAVEAFVATADAMGHFAIGTAVLLNEWIGQRKGDVIALGRPNYSAGAFRLKQNKTGAEVVLPVDKVPQLKARIELQLQRNDRMKIKSIYLLPTENGQPYSENWFAYLVRCIRDKAAELHGEQLPELKTLIFKNLRHTAVTRLAEAGCEIPQIASITGHKFRSCQEIIDRYNIRTTKMAEEAFSRRLAAESTTST